MRNAIVAFMLIGIFVLAGCKDKNTGVLKLSGIRFTADFNCKNERYTAECGVDKNKCLTAKIITPDNLNGLVFTVIDNNCTASLGDIEIDGDEVYYPDEFFLKNLYEVMVKSDGQEYSYSKENSAVSGVIDGRSYTLNVSPAGLPISLSIPEIDLKIDFNNLSIKD